MAYNRTAGLNPEEKTGDVIELLVDALKVAHAALPSSTAKGATAKRIVMRAIVVAGKRRQPTD